MARNPIGDRIALILEDLGYVDDEGKVDLDYAARVITRRAGRLFGASRLRTLVQKGGTSLGLEEAVIIADGLGIDLREIAYDEGDIPRTRTKRPTNPLDELDVI